MKKILVTVLAWAMLTVSTAQAEGIDTIATQAILVDAATGTVLLDKQANERMPTSSMSKVMSMYMVFEDLKRGRIHLDDMMTVSQKAYDMKGSRMFIQVADQVKVEDLIRGVIIQSGNDAVVALAEGIAGSEEAFVDAMNIRAKELGLANSHFTNASGWPDPDHYSTPRDLSLLAFRIINDFPEYYHYFSEREFTYGTIKQYNRDPLLGRLPGADGLKTGHTDVAGYGLIGTALRDGRRLILVVNGLQSIKDRGDESVRLMEWGYRNFESKKLVIAGEEISTAETWLGATPDISMVASKDVYVVMPKARRNEIKLTASYVAPIMAPIKKGTEIGTLKIEVPEQLPVTIPLLAGVDLERKGMFGRALDRFHYLTTDRY